jgi:hypothetical protein
MGRKGRAHPEWVLMADAGIPFEVIARLNERSPAYVRDYVRRRGDTMRGGPAPVRPVLHDRPRPKPARWRDPDRRWQVRLQELARFLHDHQRRPHISQTDPNRALGSEWSLAHWLTSQRVEHRAGRMPARRASRLDAVLPSWRLDDRSLENEARWRLNLVELLRFREAHGRLPQRTGTPGEKEVFLESWLRKQRRLHQAGALEPDRARWLDIQVPGWCRPLGPRRVARSQSGTP